MCFFPALLVRAGDGLLTLCSSPPVPQNIRDESVIATIMRLWLAYALTVSALLAELPVKRRLFCQLASD